MTERNTTIEAGRSLYDRVPKRARPGWGLSLLQAFERFVVPVPEVVRALYEIAGNENDWHSARQQFSLIREFSLDNKNFKPESYLILAEKVAKITYNGSGRDAPFDADSGWYIPELARQTASSFDEQELSAEIERILTTNE